MVNVAARSTLMVSGLKGTDFIYVNHQDLFHKGQTIIIGECFVAKIVDFGSLVLDRKLDRTFPAGTTVRAITPQDTRGVDGQNTQSTQNNQRTNQIGDRSTATDLRTENANATNTLSHATTPQARSVDGQDIQSTNRIPNSQGISDQISDRSNAPGLLTQNTDVRNTPLNNWWPPAPQPTRPMGHQSNLPTVNDAVWSTLAMTALQGTNRIYVYDQQLFHKGQMIIIHELFVAQIIDFGSLVLDRNLDQTFPAGAIVRAITPQETHNVDSQNRQSTHGIPMDNQRISNENDDRSRTLPDPPVENTSEIDTETSPLKAWLLRGMNKHGKAHWADCRAYYNEYQPTVAELDKSFRPPKPEQMRLALSIITSLPGQLEDLVRAVNEIRSFERTFIRVMKGLTPACVLYAKLLFNGVYECLRILREETTASGQAEKQFNKVGEEEKFYPQLESHVVTWMTSMLPSYVVTRAHNRKSEPSARIFLTEYYFSLFPQPGEQARHLSNLAQNPTTVSENPTDVLNNIENWRTTIQKLYELTNWIPIQEDIKTAFASLTAPVLTNIPRLKFQWNFIETISYPSINTTDAQVHKYITGIVEEIHKLPKSTKWERTEESYEAYPQEEGYEEECSTSWPKTAQEQGYVKEADESSDDGASEEQLSEEGYFEGAKGVDEEAARQLREDLENQIRRETARENKREREYRKRIIKEGYEQGLTAVQRSIEQEDYYNGNYHEEVYGPYNEEACQEETYEEEGYDDEAYNQEEGYDDEAYDGYDDEAYNQEEGYDEEAYEQEEGYDDEAYEQEDWYGDEAYQDQDQEQEWYGDEAYQDQEQEWYGDETYQDQETEWYGDEAETYEEDTSQYGQCIFFASPEGCRRGNECKYRHDCDPNTGEPLPASSKNKKRFRQSRRREQAQEASYKDLPTAGRPQELHP